MEAKIEHVLVCPDVNFVYTRRKRRLLGLEDALDPKHQNSEHHSLPTGLRKAKAFLADEYDIQTHEDQSYFYYRAKCLHSFKVREEPHNLKLALCIVSGEVEYAYCGPTGLESQASVTISGFDMPFGVTLFFIRAKG